MTKQQARDLQKKRNFDSRVGIVLTIILFGIGVFFIVHPEQVILGFVCFGLDILLIVSMIRSVAQERRLGETVEAVEGFLQIHESSAEESSGVSTFSYIVAGRSFETSEVGTRAIDPGQRYRIYYAPANNEMLNIEPVGPSISLPQSSAMGFVDNDARLLSSPYHLSAHEVGAIIGVPIDETKLNQDEENGRIGASFISQNSWLMAYYTYQPAGWSSSQKMYAMSRRIWERIDLIGTEGYYLSLASSLCFCVYEQDILCTVSVFSKHPTQMAYNRDRTFKLASTLLQKIKSM